MWATKHVERLWNSPLTSSKWHIHVGPDAWTFSELEFLAALQRQSSVLIWCPRFLGLQFFFPGDRRSCLRWSLKRKHCSARAQSSSAPPPHEKNLSNLELINADDLERQCSSLYPTWQKIKEILEKYWQDSFKLHQISWKEQYLEIKKFPFKRTKVTFILSVLSKLVTIS